MYGADSLELFEICFELVGGSIDSVSNKTKKFQWKHNITCHMFYQLDQKN